MKKGTKHLVVIGHPDKSSFCHNGIFKTIIRQMRKYKSNYKIIDLYEDKLHKDRKDLVEKYKK
jgi:putative NADPH-quinone reductase